MHEHGSDESTAGLSAERIGRNDAIFRHANEKIKEVAEAVGAHEATPFVCECADPNCRDVILMSLADYSDIRQDPRFFLNVPGHEASGQGWAQVVETHDSYVVVEKIGPAAEVAEELEGSEDPATEPVEAEERHRRGGRLDDPV